MQANNVVMLIGNVGKDPEMKQVGDFNITKFTLAVSRPVAKGKDRVTDWVNVSCFGKQAELANDLIRKGTMVSIVGSLRIDAYESNGEKRNYTTVSADSFQLLSKKEDSVGSAPPKKKPTLVDEDDFMSIDDLDQPPF